MNTFAKLYYKSNANSIIEPQNDKNYKINLEALATNTIVVEDSFNYIAFLFAPLWLCYYCSYKFAMIFTAIAIISYMILTNVSSFIIIYSILSFFIAINASYIKEQFLLRKDYKLIRFMR